MEVFEAGTAELSLEISDDLKQNYGFARGGVVSYLADNRITFAAASILGSVDLSGLKLIQSRGI